ncbi:MAG: hypothetical protein A2138_24240 [Deltaproteobacteria bacterium RBG_16_71_12]|nr:MAG: hypothetical protein A2138_24240 [Deltaproteobacteria bacterium RBG_16_71_12]
MTTPEADEPDQSLRRLDLSGRWATATLSLLNLAMFLVMLLAGASALHVSMEHAVAAGAADPGRVWQGEPWRLLTACFVHLGFWHVALNVWVLWQLGTLLERLIGGARLLLVYVAAGVFGFGVSVSLLAVPTAGASGAVFGIVGALLAVAGLARDRALGRALVRTLAPFIVATFLLGFLVPGIDNAAHAGGLIFGWLLGYGLQQGEGASDSGKTGYLGTVALVGSGVLLALVIAYSARPLLSPRYHAVAGLAALADKKLEVAKQHAEEVVRLAPDDAASLVLLARVRDEAGDPAQAQKLALQALRLFDPDPERAYAEATQRLAPWGDDGDGLWGDLRTNALLCRAALEEVGVALAPEMKNQCAWLKLRAQDPAVRDPTGALPIARAAVADSEGKAGSIVHTLAVALADNGDPAEGLALLEKLAAEDRAGELPRGFLDEERQRLKRLVSGAERPATDPVGSP